MDPVTEFPLFVVVTHAVNILFGLCAFCAFIVVHVFMVVVHGVPGEFGKIFLGSAEAAPVAATVVGSLVLVAVVLMHILATVFSARGRGRRSGRWES